MKIWAKFAFVDFVDFFVDFFSKTGKNPQMDFSGALCGRNEPDFVFLGLSLQFPGKGAFSL